jgi:putative endonuclease
MDRASRGKLSYFKGQAAEDQIAAAYERNGFDVVERRWKTKDGEIDLIAKYGEKFYFIEVKSSSTFDKAIEQITPKQQQRIHDAALTYLADKVGNLDTECRFDAALVDGAGKIKIMPGVLLAS